MTLGALGHSSWIRDFKSRRNMSADAFTLPPSWRTHKRLIPERLLMNHKCNLALNDGCDPRAELLRTRAMRLLLSVMKMEPVFWDDARCREAAYAYSTQLGFAFESEHHGAYKSDICRLLQLYNLGGYYFDTDTVVQTDVRKVLPPVVSFSSVVQEKTTEPHQFYQAFVAAAPRHPLIRNALNATLDFYLTAQRGHRFENDRDNAGKWNGAPMGDLTPCPPDEFCNGPPAGGDGSQRTRQLHGRRLYWMGPLLLRQSFERYAGPRGNVTAARELLWRAFRWWAAPSRPPGPNRHFGLIEHRHRRAPFRYSYLFFALPDKPGQVIDLSGPVGETPKQIFRGGFFTRNQGSQRAARRRAEREVGGPAVSRARVISTMYRS